MECNRRPKNFHSASLVTPVFRDPLAALPAVTRTSHTIRVKVAVSIPDEIFAEAEALAKGLKSSRSAIYSRALGEFIGHHAPDRVTDLMNDVVRELGPEPDRFSVAAGRQVLKKIEW